MLILIHMALVDGDATNTKCEVSSRSMVVIAFYSYVISRQNFQSAAAGGKGGIGRGEEGGNAGSNITPP
jgi:hypothetical protein